MTRARAIRLGLCLVLLTSACAKGGSGSGDEKPKYSMTMKTGKRLQKVRELVEKKDYQAALQELDEIAEGKYLNPYERAKIWEARAGLHLATNQPSEITTDLEQALAQDALPKQERLAATFNLAQAYFMVERFSESADTFAKWAAEADKVEPEQNYLIASAFAQAKRFKDALPYAEKAVEGNAKPPEPWLVLLASLHFELDQNAELAEVQQQLVKLYPKKEHMLQLSQTYVELGEHGKALATLENAYAKGQLAEEKELLGLARLYQRAKAPQKAAAVLDKHMKDGTIAKTPQNYELLAQAWVAAGDAARAGAALNAAGEDAIASGEVYYGLAQLEAARGEWTKARDALAAAISRGGLSAPGDAQLLLGIAHYRTNRKDVALTSLTEAKRYGSETAACAEAWIKVVKSGKAGGSAECKAGGPGAQAAARAK